MSSGEWTAGNGERAEGYVNPRNAGRRTVGNGEWAEGNVHSWNAGRVDSKQWRAGGGQCAFSECQRKTKLDACQNRNKTTQYGIFRSGVGLRG